MTPKQYLQWLDSEIEKCWKIMSASLVSSKKYLTALERRSTFAKAKEKFLTIQLPSQLTDTNTETENNFTDGLE